MNNKNKTPLGAILESIKKEEPVKQRTHTLSRGRNVHPSRKPMHGSRPHASQNSNNNAHSSKQKRTGTFQYQEFRQSSAHTKRPEKFIVDPPAPGVIRIIPVGGVEEIGRNCTIIEIGDDIIVVDVGMQFATDSTPGIDYIVPNTTYLEENKHRIRGVIITHGHLDHIGGIPVVMSRIGNPPLYSRNLSILLMQKRQAEFPHFPALDVHKIENNSSITLGKIKVRFFGVTHTVPDSVGIIIETPYGSIVTPGDYKLDQIDGIVSKEEEKEYAIFDKENVLLLMTDSTNVENEGFSLPEVKVHEGLENLIRRGTGRIIMAAFASHITRLVKIVEIAERLGKKVAIDGRSMKTNLDVSEEAGIFKPAKGTVINIEDVGKYPPDKIIILMTGAQGEEFAALNRAANKTHKKFVLGRGDTIILSASIVPGNEVAVARLKDNLARQGVHIISYRTGEEYVHATGHGNQEDIKWLHRKTHPKFFIPIHGSHYMLQRHRELALTLGMSDNNIIVPDNGSIIEIIDGGTKMVLRKEKIPASPLMIDGFAIGGEQEVVIRDRQLLAEDGMFVLVATLDGKTGKLKKSPDIISRGFVYLKNSQDLLKEARNIIKRNTEQTPEGMKTIDIESTKNKVGENLSRFLFQKTAKKPLIIPVILVM
jgi:ribonuclease J